MLGLTVCYANCHVSDRDDVCIYDGEKVSVVLTFVIRSVVCIVIISK